MPEMAGKTKQGRRQINVKILITYHKPAVLLKNDVIILGESK